MNLETRELYASPNGDRWYLARDPDSGRAFVRHIPNRPSGGRPSTIDLAAFLGGSGDPPEVQALTRLVGSLAAGRRDADEDGTLPGKDCRDAPEGERPAEW